jgi:hypothetical protein
MANTSLLLRHFFSEFPFGSGQFSVLCPKKKKFFLRVALLADCGKAASFVDFRVLLVEISRPVFRIELFGGGEILRPRRGRNRIGSSSGSECAERRGIWEEFVRILSRKAK